MCYLSSMWCEALSVTPQNQKSKIPENFQHNMTILTHFIKNLNLKVANKEKLPYNNFFRYRKYL